jgi:light-regulated signal transduction histidine kinase (bacteriophytochrome)
MISAYYGGLGPGLLATGLGAGLGSYFFMEPEQGLHPIALADQVHLALFVMIGILISLLNHAMRQARKRASDKAAALTASENELRAAVTELARSNAELDQFASVVSHDLRSPMVTISGYAHLLQVHQELGLTSELREALMGIGDGIKQMDALLETLRTYSRLGRAELKLRACNGQAVFDRVLKTLERQLADVGAQVTCDALPEVQADEVLLSQTLQNLIENAVKYRSHAHLRIHVSARREAAGWVFSVQDNGIGIAAEHHQRIFQMGRRLHPDESQYAGCGIGLATCKKIIARHGGRIWVESEPGKGSTFCFSLPAQEKRCIPGVAQ